MFEFIKKFLSENLKSSFRYSSKEGKIFLRANKKEIRIELTDFFETSQSSSCIQSSYCILCSESNYGKLFMEYIRLQSGCDWQSLPHGNFRDLIKSELKIGKMETIEQYDLKNFEISCFQIDDIYKLYTIVIYEGGKYIFFVDYEGRLYKDIATAFNIDIKQMPKLQIFPKNYKGSLGKMNMIEGYLSRD